MAGQGKDGGERPDEIRFDRPGSHMAALPYRIAAAGRTRVQAAAPLIRQRFNQHVLILPLQGCGLIRLGPRTFHARPGTLVWQDTARRYEHGCAPGSAVWHYLWLGIQGHGLDALFSSFRVDADPLIPSADVGWIADSFAAVIDRLRDPDSASAAENNATVARLIAFVARARGNLENEAGPGDASMVALADQMRGGLGQPWRIGDLAKRAHLSPSQLHRRFRQAYGATPMDWLRHERIHAAKGLLVGSAAKIAAIAAECGYGDPYHFSRDFARLTGQPPSAFRRTGGR